MTTCIKPAVTGSPRSVRDHGHIRVGRGGWVLREPGFAVFSVNLGGSMPHAYAMRTALHGEDRSRREGYAT